jgi:putative restriction endonuclease
VNLILKKYGEIGKNYIEGHHIIPVSDLKNNEGTKVSDIVMLCSNCHSMIHRRRPWLGINDLKSFINQLLFEYLDYLFNTNVYA